MLAEFGAFLLRPLGLWCRCKFINESANWLISGLGPGDGLGPSNGDTPKYPNPFKFKGDPREPKPPIYH